MAKLTKRTVDSLRPNPERDVFAWDGEIRGFGIRVKPTGVKSYLIQYRNTDGRTRRLVLGKHGTLTAEEARNIARQKLASVARGDDPSAERHAARAGITVAEVCDWYLEHGRGGRILGRNRCPIKVSTLDMDKSRINAHIKPLIGSQPVRGLTLADIERLQADIASGRTAIRTKRQGRGGRTAGGAGVAARSISTLHSLFAHARRWGLIDVNPAEGVRLIASKKKDRRLSVDELCILGKTMKMLAAEGEHPTGLSAIRLMLLTGLRRMEALGMQRAWVSESDHCVRFPDTKTGEQVRVIGKAALDVIAAQPIRDDSQFIFPADWGQGHFIGIVRILDRVCTKAKLEAVTPHVLRHTFASIAAELGFTELTIAGLLGHASRGITQRYIHLDAALIVAADKVALEIARHLDGGRDETVAMNRL